MPKEAGGENHSHVKTLREKEHPSEEGTEEREGDTTEEKKSLNLGRKNMQFGKID